MKIILIDGPAGLTSSDMEEEVSKDHFHLSIADARTLFGSDEFPCKRPLSIAGQFASWWRVEVTDAFGVTRAYTVVGGPRTYSQGEFTKSAYARLFGIPTHICPARRQSGDLEDARSTLVKGPCGSVLIPIIIAADHAHSGNPDHVGKSLFIMSPLTGVMGYIPIKAGETTDRRVHVHLDAEHGRQWEHVPTIPEITYAFLKICITPIEINLHMARWCMDALCE